MGLLLLRAAAGTAAVSHGASCLAHSAPGSAVTSAVALAGIAAGAALAAGFLTPAAAGAVSLSTLILAAVWTPSSSAALGLSPSAAALVAVDGLALALLGPGAHSVDAWLFGRREIIIPGTPRAGDRR